MKRFLLYCFFYFGCSGLTLAQISYSVFKQDVKCNFSSPGSIEINVVEVNPPYYYSWESGESTPLIAGLVPGNYTVTVSDAAGNDTVITVEIKELICEMNPELGFSPNGDGYNDTWFINNAIFFPEALVMVYDRAGQKVFENVGLYSEPWEGKNRLNIALPSASYYYIIYPDRKDESVIIKGSVTIIK
ncbi:MAG: gliding motility-associated C-terminal domain-containing protein [Bacteroidota bacterium]|nr:gliding motility-associated C-terminal domain-containing protein [Bacteroidota bacterium]